MFCIPQPQCKPFAIYPNENFTYYEYSTNPINEARKIKKIVHFLSIAGTVRYLIINLKSFVVKMCRQKQKILIPVNFLWIRARRFTLGMGRT